jgi:hypothetical protein
MLRSLILVVLLSSICLALAVAATAQDKRAAREACYVDYQRFCASVAPGQGRIRKCLLVHIAELAPACQTIIERNKRQ